MYNIAMLLFCYLYFVFFSHTPIRRSTGLSCLQRRNNEPRCVISRWCLHVLHRAGHPGAASLLVHHLTRHMTGGAWPGQHTSLMSTRRCDSFAATASPSCTSLPLGGLATQHTSVILPPTLCSSTLARQ